LEEVESFGGFAVIDDVAGGKQSQSVEQAEDCVARLVDRHDDGPVALR